MDKNTKYAEAKMALDSAMAEFIEAARRVEFSEHSIASSICDSAYDATNGQIMLDVHDTNSEP